MQIGGATLTAEDPLLDIYFYSSQIRATARFLGYLSYSRQWHYLAQKLNSWPTEKQPNRAYISLSLSKRSKLYIQYCRTPTRQLLLFTRTAKAPFNSPKILPTTRGQNILTYNTTSFARK